MSPAGSSAPRSSRRSRPSSRHRRGRWSACADFSIEISVSSCVFCLICCSTCANCTSCWVNWLVSSGSSGFWFLSCVVSSVRNVWKLPASVLLSTAPLTAFAGRGVDRRLDARGGVGDDRGHVGFLDVRRGCRCRCRRAASARRRSARLRSRATRDRRSACARLGNRRGRDVRRRLGRATKIAGRCRMS